MITLEEPSQHLGKADQPDDRARAHKGNRHKIPVVDSAEYKLVLAQQDEDKRAGDAGQNHRADSQRTAENEKPPAFRRLQGNQPHQHIGPHCAH